MPEELSLPQESMTYFFEESVRRVPDVDALRRFDETISYSEFNDFADRFATLPASWGVEKGGRVAVYAQDDPQFLIARAYASSIALYRSTAGVTSLRASSSPTSGLFPATCASSMVRGGPPGGRSQ